VSRQIIQPRDEAHWLELRSQDLTSTEIGALFGLSPYVTLYELWHRKKNQIVVKLEENERMKWGNLLQDAIAEGIAKEQGWTIRRMTEYIRGSDLRIGASFDFSIENTGTLPGVTHLKETPKLAPDQTDNEIFGKGLLEIKNVDSLIFKQNWLEGDDGKLEAPLHIEIQVQHQLLVSGRAYAYIGALVGGNNLVLLKRDRNTTICNKIKDKAKSFWESIENNTPPEPNFQTDSKFIASLYGFAEPGKYVDLAGDQDILHMAKQYKELGDQAKEAGIQREGIKAKILTLIGDAEKASGDLFSISAGMIGPTHIEYDRKGYRNFRISWRKKK